MTKKPEPRLRPPPLPKTTKLVPTPSYVQDALERNGFRVLPMGAKGGPNVWGLYVETMGVHPIHFDLKWAADESVVAGSPGPRDPKTRIETTKVLFMASQFMVAH